MSEWISFTLNEISSARTGVGYIKSDLYNVKSVFESLLNTIDKKLADLISIYEDSIKEVQNDVYLLDDVIRDNEDEVEEREVAVKEAHEAVAHATDETRSSAKSALKEAQDELRDAEHMLEAARRMQRQLKNRLYEYRSAISTLRSNRNEVASCLKSVESYYENAHSSMTKLEEFADKAHEFAEEAIDAFEKALSPNKVSDDARVSLSDHRALYYAATELRESCKELAANINEVSDASDIFAEGLTGKLATAALNKIDELCEIFEGVMKKLPKRSNGLFQAYTALNGYVNIE